jgi:hypothetical protein
VHSLFLSFVAAGGGGMVALSKLQRRIAWALHSGTVVALLDACRTSDEISVTPSAPIGELWLRHFMQYSVMVLR